MLRDGTSALIRPIRPDDKTRLQEGLRQLSPRSRYLRFHAPVDHLTEEQLRYLTEIDYDNHMAWVAVNPETPDEAGMGVARYVRLADEPDIAEAAVTVIDRYQGKGLGTILLQVLSESAVRHGIRKLRNYVLADNTAMLEIFDEIGAERVLEGDGVYRVDVDLPADREVHPARAILRGIARGVIPPLEWTFPANAVLRRGDGWLARLRRERDEG